MGLEQILQELGAKKPFEDSEDLTGDYTTEGYQALYKLLHIISVLDRIGAAGKKGSELELCLKKYIHYEKFLHKLLRIADGLDYIGALGKKGTDLENYLEEIVRLGF